MTLTPDQLHELPHVISAPRFATYLRAMANDKAGALALYRWNLEISAAFIVPLQICEVAMRNGVVEVLEKVHGSTWPWSSGFIRSLPRPTGYDPAIDLQRVAKRLPTAGKVIAELKFAFWAKLFTKGQDQRLWVPHFRGAFPGVDTSMTIPKARENAYAALEEVRTFRNRIAHHEPIFSRNLGEDYARIHEMIAWRSPVAATWVDQIQTVTGLIDHQPKP